MVAVDTYCRPASRPPVRRQPPGEHDRCDPRRPMSRSTSHRPQGRNDEPGDDTRTRMFRRWCAGVRRRMETILATGAIAVLAVIGVGHGAAVAATPAAGYG